MRSSSWVWFCVGLVGFLWSSVEVLGKEAPLQEKITKERKGLGQLKKEIRKTQKKRDSAQKKQNALLQNMETLDRQLVQLRHEHAQIDRQIHDVDQAIREIALQLTEVQSRMKTKRHAVLNRLRLLYLEGRGRYLQPLLAAQNFDAFQRRFDALSAMANRDYALFEAYRGDVEKIDHLKQQRMNARLALLNHKTHIDQKRRERKAVQAKKHVLFTSLKKEQTLHEQALAALQRREHSKETLLKALEQKRKLTQSRVPKQKHTKGKTSQLLWPVEGTVVSRFGRQKHLDFDTFVNKKGIEIQTNNGSAIQAVSSGKVVYADWLKGYGLVVILDHADDYFSLYAHASELLVKEGERVPVGHLLGRTGDSGLTEGNKLYFELREGTTPVDPLKFLVKRP
ncbi:MAG: peptidoglycan DD-metalloendopeptidase family protein [Nitrospirales bacterium]|nr:peptidoglycan DD-metalloendopeptidase family protein [Nitrospirales bacterium]